MRILMNDEEFLSFVDKELSLNTIRSYNLIDKVLEMAAKRLLETWDIVKFTNILIDAAKSAKLFNDQDRQAVNVELVCELKKLQDKFI